MQKLKTLIKEFAASSRHTKFFFLWTFLFLVMMIGYTFYTYAWLGHNMSGVEATK